MAHSNQTELQAITTPWEVFKPYLAYVVMFVGTGLISGSIVHVAQEENRGYAIILMLVGAVLFAVGSLMNEVLFKTGLLGDTPVRYVLLSLLLACGIGMISGSTQHFFDTPIYASYLAPLGIFLSSLAFAIRQGYILHKKSWVGMIIGGIVFAGVLHLALNTYAKTLPETQGHHSSPEAASHAEPETHVTNATAHEAAPTTPTTKTHNDGHTDADHQKK
jgi:hypothetical protein